MLVKCPYCQKELTKFPGRKTTCPHCSNFIYVRTKPSDDRQRILVREDQLEKLEEEWQKYSQKYQAAAEFKRGLQNSDLGFTEKQYLKVKEDLTKRFGFNPSEGDILWGVSNLLLEEAMKEGNWHRMKMIYFNQALFLHQEDKDCFKILQEVARCELKDKQKSGVVGKVEILTAGKQSCSACQKLAGKILTIEEALKEMPLPIKNCSFKLNPKAPTGWCRCCYIPVVE
jgi:DNA-directed RNA polymerase subunit RPC12/RpoP